MDSKINIFRMKYVPPNFKLSILLCPQPFKNNTCLAFIHFPFHSQLQKTQLFSPYTFRESLSIPGRRFPTTALSQNLFTHPGLIEIPEAAGSSDSIRDRRMQNRSREYFPEENGLPPQADLT